MKKVIVAFGIAVTVVSANASYLYWAVTESDPGIASAIEWTSGWENPGYNSATLYVYETEKGHNTATAVTTYDYVNPSGHTVIKTLGGESGTVYADVSAFADSGSKYSFFIELRNSKAEQGSGAVAWSSSQTYAELATADVIYENVLDPATELMSSPVWHGTNYHSAPEPTSAMLMLLGVAGLALRRKQRKA